MENSLRSVWFLSISEIMAGSTRIARISLTTLTTIAHLSAIPAQAVERKAPLYFELPARVYFIDVRIGDAAGAQQEIPFIFDTGAAYSIIHPLDLEQVKHHRIGGKPFYMPDGSKRFFELYQVSQVTIGDCTLQDVKMLAGEDTVANFLGANVLTRIMPFTVTKDAVSFQCPSQENQQSLNKGTQR